MKMRKLILGALVAFTVVSCNQKKIEHLEFQKDSLQQVKDSVVRERDNFLEIIAEIQSNFQSIRQTELGILDQTQGGEVINSSTKAQLREDFQRISEKLQAQRERIGQLEESLKSAQGQASKYKNLVASLQKDLETKTKEIADLKAQLEEKNVKIEELSKSVSSLTTSKDSLNSLSEKQLASIKQQEIELNAGYYLTATKKELKEKGLKEGVLKTAKVDKGNFKKVDIREFKELELNTKKAKLYTLHPASSYSLEKKSADDKMLVLKIKDPKAFWSNSRILIVEVK
jgi:chromosome segregation ATPase